MSPSSTDLRRAHPVVAIDGPAGAGKSTLAAHLAACFGLLNLETGAMYRALALQALRSRIDLADAAGLAALCARTSIVLEPQPSGNRVLLDGEEVTGRLRAPEIAAAASQVSVHPQVRAQLVAAQRALGAAGGVVMEGRDIGTAVFPDAEIKIFLDADPAVRGSRRFQQGGATQPASEAAVIEELRERDRRDRNRAESPLRPAPDAVLLDSSGLTLDEVLARGEAIVRAYLAPD